MRSALIHGALLLVMLIFAWRTWNRDKSTKRDLGSVVLWDKKESDLVSIEYTSDKKTLKLVRRGEGDSAYWWATETNITKRPKAKPPEKKDAGSGSGSAASTGSGSGSGSGSAVAAGSGSGSAKPAAGSGSAVAAGSGSGSAVAAGSGSGSAAPAAGSGSGSAVAAGSGSAKPAAGSGSGSAVAQSGSGSGSGSAVAAGSGSAGSGSGSGSAVAKAGSGSGSAKAPPPPPPEMEEVRTTHEFPLGTEGDKLIEAYASARALRDLGEINDELKKSAKLGESKITATVTFKSDPQRKFVIGQTADTSVRYLQDAGSNVVYVVSSEMFKGLELGENNIHLSDARGFDDKRLKEVDSVVIEAGGKSKSVGHVQTEVDGKQVKVWGDPTTGKSEPALASFVESLNQLRPIEFVENPKVKPQLIMTITYKDEKGSNMATLGLYRGEKPGAAPPPTDLDDPANPPKGEPEYYVQSEKTHAFAIVTKNNAQNVENSLMNVMSDNPVAPPEPKKEPLKLPGAPGPGKKPPLGIPGHP